MDTASIVSVMSLAVALAALFIAPHFSHKQAVAQMRQAWIHSLRDCVAEFLALACSPDLAWAFRDNDADLPSDAYKQLVMLETKIELLLNPKEDTHKRLITACHGLVDLLHKRKRQMSDRQFIDQKADLELSITAATQKIIRDEWTRTKRFFM